MSNASNHLPFDVKKLKKSAVKSAVINTISQLNIHELSVLDKRKTLPSVLPSKHFLVTTKCVPRMY